MEEKVDLGEGGFTISIGEHGGKSEQMGRKGRESAGQSAYKRNVEREATNKIHIRSRKNKQGTEVRIKRKI